MKPTQATIRDETLTGHIHSIDAQRTGVFNPFTSVPEDDNEHENLNDQSHSRKDT